MKILKTFIIAIAIVCLFPVSSLAEHSVGFAAGSTRGLGATYRYLPDPGDVSPWGWQVTGLPLITKTDGVVSLGAGALYLLHRGELAMAYASFGVGTLFSWSNCTDNSDTFCEDESNWGGGLGPGLGFELRAVDNLGWSVEIPLAIMFADGEFYGMYPVPNTSLVYHW